MGGMRPGSRARFMAGKRVDQEANRFVAAFNELFAAAAAVNNIPYVEKIEPLDRERLIAAMPEVYQTWIRKGILR